MNSPNLHGNISPCHESKTGAISLFPDTTQAENGLETTLGAWPEQIANMLTTFSSLRQVLLAQAQRIEMLERALRIVLEVDGWQLCDASLVAILAALEVEP